MPNLVEEGFDFGGPEPATLEEAEQRRLVVLTDLETIQDQLSKNGYKDDGSFAFPSMDEYMAWRGSAKVALRHKHAQARSFKRWIRDHREGPAGHFSLGPIEEVPTANLIAALHAIATELGRRAKD